MAGWWEDTSPRWDPQGRVDSVQMTDNMFNLGRNPAGIQCSDWHAHTTRTHTPTHTQKWYLSSSYTQKCWRQLPHVHKRTKISTLVIVFAFVTSSIKTSTLVPNNLSQVVFAQLEGITFLLCSCQWWRLKQQSFQHFMLYRNPEPHPRMSNSGTKNRNRRQM